jgi:hypothetical protein
MQGHYHHQAAALRSRRTSEDQRQAPAGRRSEGPTVGTASTRSDEGCSEHHKHQPLIVFARKFHHRQAPSATPCREKSREGEEWSSVLKAAHIFSLPSYMSYASSFSPIDGCKSGYETFISKSSFGSWILSGIKIKVSSIYRFDLWIQITVRRC